MVTAMRPSLAWVSWYSWIGWPNTERSSEYCRACSSAACMTPSARAAVWSRPFSNPAIW